MKKLFPVLVIIALLFSSCTPATTIPEPTITTTNTVVPTPTQTQIPIPTSILTLIPTLTPTSTLSPDTMIYNFDSDVSIEDQALVKQGVQTARHYLINYFGSDIKGSYLINVANNPNDQSDINFARVNGPVMTLNVGHQLWLEYDQAWRLKLVIHETTHFWQQEQGDGPGCGFLYDAVGYPASHDPMTNVMDEGHAEYVGFMAAGLEEEAFSLTDENLVGILSPVNRNLESSYEVMKAGVYWLIQQKGPMAFTKYCTEVVQGKAFPVAFENGFGMTVEKFTTDFKQYLSDGLSKLCSENSTCNKDKLSTVWQAQNRCFSFTPNNVDPLLGFITMGVPRYIIAVAEGKESERLFSDNFALFFWPVDQYNENRWFDNTDVAGVAVRYLIEDFGYETYEKYCDGLGRGIQPRTAFQSAYGMSIADFRDQFMDQVLGYYKNCTVSTCGEFNWDRGDQMKNLIDESGVISFRAKFIDESGAPLPVNTIMICRQTVSQPSYCTGISEDGVPSIYEEALIPGTYMFGFCDPHAEHRDEGCLYGAYETGWFDISEGKVTDITFAVPPIIEDATQSDPNLVVKFLDENGNSIPNFPVKVCNYDSAVMACSVNLDEPGYKHTNSEGVFEGSFRKGKYLIRFAWPNSASSSYTLPLYEISNININESSLTAITYQFPKPNVIIKLTNANGITVPLQGFLLCKAIEELGNCLVTSANPWGWWVSTNDKGLFEGFLEPGDYFILTNIDLTSLEDRVDFKIPFTVASETDVVSIEYQLIK